MFVHWKDVLQRRSESLYNEMAGQAAKKGSDLVKGFKRMANTQKSRNLYNHRN